jgi:hypothetical protein
VLQVAALEELLGFLAGVGPFKGLSRELLTAVSAVCCVLQVAALEELLGFLAGVGPFKGLSRELLNKCRCCCLLSAAGCCS